MKYRSVALILLCILAASVHSNPPALLINNVTDASDAENHYDEFLTRIDTLADVPYPEQSAAIEQAYSRIFSSYIATDFGENKLTDRDLYFLLIASEAALSIINSEEIADYAQRVFDILQDRGEPDLASISSYYRAMIYSGNFPQALTVEPLVREMPLVRLTSNRDEIGEKTRAVHVRLPGTEQYELQNGTVIKNGVYVVGHMFCPWTRQALADLLSDADTRDYVEQHAVFMAPKSTLLQQASGFPIENKDFSVVLDQSQWPEVTRWALPTFVFVEDGNVVHQIDGWPSADRMTEFKSAMRSQGRRLRDPHN